MRTQPLVNTVNTSSYKMSADPLYFIVYCFNVHNVVFNPSQPQPFIEGAAIYFQISGLNEIQEMKRHFLIGSFYLLTN